MGYSIRVRASALIIQDEQILLVEFNDDNGLHYNLPAGGVEPGESVAQAVKREAWEEARAEVEIGPLAFVYEYAPHQNGFKYKSPHTLDLVYRCDLVVGSSPQFPPTPDPDQTDVKWVSLNELPSVNLLPRVASHIIRYAHQENSGAIFLAEFEL